MFSPDSTLNISTLPASRNPRRRQRTHSDESTASLPPRNKKRQRSFLSQDTFSLPSGKAQDGEESMQGDRGNISLDGDASSRPKQLVVREKSRSSKRGGKGDGSLTLTKNDSYIVTQLPAFPDHFRTEKNARLHGAISFSHGYALAITATQAHIWSYTSPQSLPAESFSFELRNASRGLSDPLPIGSLTTRSASSTKPGLVIVMPVSGQIIYWESIASAATADLMRQRQQCVEGSIGSMLSGETIVQIVDAEPAGFVLNLSSGRVAHLRVRDPQGRPAVLVQVLRSYGASSGGGGLFSGLKYVLGGGGWRRDVVATRAGKSHVRGQRDVVIASAKGIFQCWDINWSGHVTLRGEFDAGQEIKASVGLDAQDEHSYEVLDFAFAPVTETSTDVSIAGPGSEISIIALVASRASNGPGYSLIELLLGNDRVKVQMVHKIRCYTTPVPAYVEWKPRIYLPEPAHTAFVVFDTAIVLASLKGPENTPESQLLFDSHKLPEPFEDAIDFRKDTDYHVVGCGVEDSYDKRMPRMNDETQLAKHPGCALLIKGYGVVRVAAFEPKENNDDIQQAIITAKSKIEQAVFYGANSENLLSFSGRSEVQFPQDEVEMAALTISDEITKTTSEFIPALNPSLDQQLRQKAIALQNLALHMKANYPPLSRLTKWKLIWNAERIASGRAIWKSYDSRLKHKDRKHSTLLSEIVVLMNEDLKSEPDPELGELDEVRQWFIKDIWRLENLVPWAWKAVVEVYNEGTKDHPTIMGLISEADDISLGALETAFRFRELNAEIYGLENEPLQDGILTSAYEGLPQFWTSTWPVAHTTKNLVDLAREMALSHWNKPLVEGGPDPKVVKKVGEENVRLVEMCCLTYIEHYRWCLAQEEDAMRNAGTHVKLAHFGVREVQMTKLSQLGLTDQAIALAEKYGEVKALVSLVGEEVGDLSLRIAEPGVSAEEAAFAENRLLRMQELITRYFGKFGDDWARALFINYIRQNRLGSLLDDNNEFQPYLSRFLRQDPRWSKLCWINDITGEHDYLNASNTLLDIAQKQEKDLWGKKVELSLGKLAWLAGHEGKQVSDEDIQDRVESINDELTLVEIQERVFNHMHPALYGAIDDKAALQLAMDQYGVETVKGKPALHQLLELGIASLVSHQTMNPEQLINVLTLMDSTSKTEDTHGEDSIAGQEFTLALQILRLSEKGMNKDRKALMEKIIWRRCMIKDDWEEINNTANMDDAAVEQTTHDTFLFRTLRDCHLAHVYKNISVPLLSPDQVLGAGCEPRELRPLFGTKEDLVEPVAHDLQAENDALQHYLDKGRLRDWYAGIVAAAQQNTTIGAEAMPIEEGEEVREAEAAVHEWVFPEAGVPDPGSGLVDVDGDVEMGE
ncbi:MAG: hypothetical protein M1819_002009 [Sarea resinae]|nr:MAG: hypothetical protein M1819_002009 [Sarea resinae]